MVLQLVKKFPALYRTQKFITVFTSARHLSLSWANSIQSPPPPTSRRSILILSSHLRLKSHLHSSYIKNYNIHNWHELWLHVSAKLDHYQVQIFIIPNTRDTTHGVSSPLYNLLGNVTFLLSPKRLPQVFVRKYNNPIPVEVRSKAWVCDRSFLKLRVRIPPAAWFCFVIVCFQLEIPVTGRSLVQRSRIEIGVSLP